MTNLLRTWTWLLAGIASLVFLECRGSAAFVRPLDRRGPFSFSGCHDGGNRGPPPCTSQSGSGFDDSSSSVDPLIVASWWNTPAATNSTTTTTTTQDLSALRGGSSRVKRKSQVKGNADKIVQGAKTTLEDTKSFWGGAMSSAGHTLTTPIRAAKRLLENKDQKAERELLEQLQTMPVRLVTIPNTTVVPDEVVHLAARRSGLIGNPLRTDRVQAFAAALKRWYHMRGYVLHCVTGATLKADTGTAEIQVQEPRVCQKPVDITFCKEMIVDEETGHVLTFRQYKERHSKRRTVGSKLIRSKADISGNTTFVETSGRTKASRIAKALSLQPGRPFCWDADKWRQVASSGVFGRILRASPERMRDGSVQLQILATEAPPRHLEYGITKSLYTGSWEGEVDFQHDNLLGGGETLSLMVRRGTKDPEPSVRLRFSDDKFGMAGGYDLEVFSDFIGDQPEGEKQLKKKGGDEGNSEEVLQDEPLPSFSPDADKLLDRKGATFRYRNPIDPQTIRDSLASVSLERVVTVSGARESIGSGSLGLGPFRRELPFDARTSLGGSVTAGCRVPDSTANINEDSTTSGLTLLPYTSLTVTTRQVLPLLSSSSSSTVVASSRPFSLVDRGRQPTLALRHTLTTATRNLPRHEQNALGFASVIRGGTPNGQISTSITGTTELRIPIQIPVLKQVNQDASLVLFGDWSMARRALGSPFFSKRSIGVGIRKATQGIPLKLDFSYTGDGKIKSSFGLGKDFDV